MWFRLSKITSKTGKNGFFCVLAYWPYRWSHINALKISSSYPHKTIPWNFLENIENQWFWKSQGFFWNFCFWFDFFLLWRSVKIYRLEWMGLNFDDYSGFQPKITHPKHFWPRCTLKICMSTNTNKRLEQMIALNSMKKNIAMYCAVQCSVHSCSKLIVP